MDAVELVSDEDADEVVVLDDADELVLFDVVSMPVMMHITINPITAARRIFKHPAVWAAWQCGHLVAFASIHSLQDLHVVS